jgi:hypothetical protein
LGERKVLLTAKILLTLATLGYSAIPALFDSNNTHATNPSWTAHARYHVVWQVSSYVYVALIALFLIWTAGADKWPLWIAALLAAATYGGFWTAAIFKPVFSGRFVDEVNGVPPFKFGSVEADANVTLFVGFVLVLAAGVWALFMA